MDDTAKLLAEIGDLLQQQVELITLERQRAMSSGAEREVMDEESPAAPRRDLRTYGRVAGLGLLLILLVVVPVIVALVWRDGR